MLNPPPFYKEIMTNHTEEKTHPINANDNSKKEESRVTDDNPNYRKLRKLVEGFEKFKSDNSYTHVTSEFHQAFSPLSNIPFNANALSTTSLSGREDETNLKLVILNQPQVPSDFKTLTTQAESSDVTRNH